MRAGITGAGVIGADAITHGVHAYFFQTQAVIANFPPYVCGERLP